ncbi:MAG TPA: hypothetical protein VF690_13080 [Hymenobacter sp.]
MRPDGALGTDTLDRSDAAGVGTAGLLARGVLRWEELLAQQIQTQ